MGLNPIQFVPLYQGEVVGLAKLEPWIRTWWGESGTSLIVNDWFEHKGDNLLWDQSPTVGETSLEFLLESRLQRTYKTHLIVFPQLMTFWSRNHMGK